MPDDERSGVGSYVGGTRKQIRRDMISPASMNIIQIEVTNSCIHHCSNCTRFCGLHEKNFMMTLEQFRQAVDSLAGFPGVVGVMGGEPTLNPEFPEMIRYLAQARPGGRRPRRLLAPVRDFNRFHRGNWNNLTNVRRGLWSALGRLYYENLEAISDIFPYQCLNDHKNSGLHQALLIPRKELGIADEEWLRLRDKCWIQNEWSASITPRGAFFCEIAAALDMLFDGPGGWPVEPGWWKRTPEEFGDQLHWCEMCSAALAVPRIEGNRETDIISPGIWERLKDRKAWKVVNGRCRVFDVADYDPSRYSVNYSGEPYLSDGDLRVSQDTGNTLFPHEIAVLCRKGGVPPAGEKFFPITEERAAKSEFKDWLLIVSGTLPEATVEFIAHAVFNPGVLYHAPGGEAVLLNRRASALEGCDALPLSLRELKRLYPAAKRYRWSNWKRPDAVTLHERWQKFCDHCRDCWDYRSGLVLKKLGLKGR